MTTLCHCGKPLHYSDPDVQRTIEDLCKQYGENVTVTVGFRHWLVQRHYVALHGLKADELPSLGFSEIGPEEYVVKPGTNISPMLRDDDDCPDCKGSGRCDCGQCPNGICGVCNGSGKFPYG